MLVRNKLHTTYDAVTGVIYLVLMNAIDDVDFYKQSLIFTSVLQGPLLPLGQCHILSPPVPSMTNQTFKQSHLSKDINRI